MEDETGYLSNETEIEEVLRVSREEYERNCRASTSTLATSSAGPSRILSQSSSTKTRTSTSGTRQAGIEQRIRDINAEIAECENQIARETARQKSLQQQREHLRAQIPLSAPAPAPGKGKGRSRTVDFFDRFDWSDELILRAREVFGIEKFRLCQEGVCNANLAGRDIVCVMPTGGGKSLTYQLPAILTSGCTIVVSPLISLMTDQVLHLDEFGVSAVMLSSAVSHAESRKIQAHLHAMASGECAPRNEVKLCYVTPEKLGQDKNFWSLLNKLYEARKLARFVIDEAHCVSEMGHDYRPHYKDLGKLRTVFRKVPILALSATCPPKVLQDISRTLGLQYPPKRGAEAEPQGTVYFSAPLYRKNLHYSVLSKPNNFADAIKVTREFILNKHRNQSGIIYCLSKKDVEHVAKELASESNGQIRTGIYHAEVPDARKAQLHREWREGKVNVVCATIAFGLGIDKADVRFVIHHSLPKSVEGLYQESGRAGRDGKDADCVLLYNPKDADRVFALTSSIPQSRGKLMDILRFVQDFEGCRKIFFANYFSVSAQLSVEEWTTEETAALDPCGHCDNCTRAPGSVKRVDLRLPAWQTLRAAEDIKRCGARLTLRQLGELVRGLGRGKVNVSGTRHKRTKGSITIDMAELAGGKVQLSREETEMLCIHLLIHDYLQEEFVPNKHTTNTYLVPGDKARRFTSLARSDVVEKGLGPKLESAFPVTGKRKAAAKDPGKDGVPPPAARAKRKRPAAPRPGEQEDGYDEAVAHEGDDIDDITYVHRRKGADVGGTINVHHKQGNGRNSPIVIEDSDEGDDDDVEGAEDGIEGDVEAFEDDVGDIDIEDEDGSDEDWSFSLRSARPLKRTRLQPYVELPMRRAPVDDDVISIDSD